MEQQLALQFARYFKSDQLTPYLYYLYLKMQEGHVCLNLNLLPQYLMNDSTFKQHELSVIDEESKLITHHPNNQLAPFVLQDHYLYTQRMYQYESSFIDKVEQYIHVSNVVEIGNLDKVITFIRMLFPEEGSKNYQKMAAVLGYLQRLLIITGGPGTGKTTTVSKLLALFIQMQRNDDAEELKIMLAAPTGKAQARLKESLLKIYENFDREHISIDQSILDQIAVLQPSTIHKLLGYTPNSVHFKHNDEHPIDADILIVDECSMIDIALFHKLLKAVDFKRTRLILLGDKHQLSSVDAGSLFGDLCESVGSLEHHFSSKISNALLKFEININEPLTETNKLNNHLVALKKSHRFKDEEGIGRLSKAILENDWGAISSFYISEQTIVVQEHGHIQYEGNDPLDYFMKQISTGVNSYTNEGNYVSALEMINQYKILCATKHGVRGTFSINQKVGELIKNQSVDHAELWAKYKYYDNQLLMVTKNQLEGDLSNGDIGIVRKDDQGHLVCYFSEGKSIVPWAINQSEDAYALTIHKSQGSEFDHVLILLPELENREFLTRELIYTAVTRAKKSVIIMGNPSILQKAIATQMPRNSGVVHRLQKA